MKKFILLTLFALLVACGGDFKVSDIAGNWQLLSMDGQLAPKIMSDDGAVTLEIQADGKFAGQAPVNRYFGQIKVDGKTISTGPIGSTMMAGSPELMQAEQVYFQALGEHIKSAKVANGQLIITAMDGKTLVFNKKE